MDGNTVGVFGSAGGTYLGKTTPDGRFTWRLPAAWRAEVTGEQISVWQVFCDSKIPYGIMELAGNGPG